MPQEEFSGKNSANFTFRDLPKPKKVAVVFLILLAISVLVFWVWEMRQNINKPFDYSKTSTATSTSNSEEDMKAVLKSRDTDSDGLSDYDEIYTYKTSPYLEDSDSDGLSDQKEVAQGTNPNCPQGKDCTISAPEAVATSTTDINSLTPATTLNSETTLTTNSANEELLQKALSGQADAATLRQLLISGGANKEELDKISDLDLLKSYQETLNSQNSSATSTSSAGN